jgi:hypothetical protein
MLASAIFAVIERNAKLPFTIPPSDAAKARMFNKISFHYH